MRSVKLRLLAYLKEVVRLKKSPHSIALGIGIGSFIGIMPTPGLNLLLGLVVTAAFKKVSKVSLFAAILFWNPFIAAILYAPSLAIGETIFGSTPVVTFDIAILNNIATFTRRFLVGITIVASIVSVTLYVVAMMIGTYVNKKKRAKM
jgi:uncharacterized protein (DUF2062 family)